MGKVVVYEDASWDLENRYSTLFPEHDVHAFLFDDPQFEPETQEQFVTTLETLERAGFRRDQIHRGLPDTHPEADVYFVDGMYGKCFELLPHLPKDRSYVYTGSPSVVKQAQQEGYNIVWSDDEIPGIARKHSSE